MKLSFISPRVAIGLLVSAIAVWIVKVPKSASAPVLAH